jgi:hypothetical protein
MTHVRTDRVRTVMMIFNLYNFFMSRKKRARSEVADEPPPHLAPTLQEYMWGELGKLLRQHSPYSTSDISILSQKKFR